MNTKIEARLCADNYRLLHELQENYPRIKVNFDTANLELTFNGHPYDVGNAMLLLFSWLKKRHGIRYSEYQNVFHVALRSAHLPSSRGTQSLVVFTDYKQPQYTSIV